MDLIDRYVEEISSALPRRLRQDVAMELHSSLEESLEARRAKKPDEDVEEAVLAVLSDFGPPSELAGSYWPNAKYLVGPTLYPAFKATVGICVLALALLTVMGILSSLGGAPSPWQSLEAGLGDALEGFLRSSLTLLGILVVVFAIIERVAGAPRKKARKWDPRSLPAAEDPNRISRFGLVVKMALLMVAFYALNFTSHNPIGSFLTADGRSGWIPLVSPDLSGNLWILNLLIGLEILLSFWLLRRGRWQPLTRWLDLGTTLLLAVLLYRFAFGASLIAVDPVWMVGHGWSPETTASYVDLVQETISPLVSIALRIGFFGTCVTALLQLFRLLSGRTPARSS
jgi:hypothetical protein